MKSHTHHSIKMPALSLAKPEPLGRREASAAKAGMTEDTCVRKA